MSRFKPVAVPEGRWLCQCGMGHHAHEHRCVNCRRPYTPLPDNQQQEPEAPHESN